jgi:hypothetical protein
VTGDGPAMEYQQALSIARTLAELLESARMALRR